MNEKIEGFFDVCRIKGLTGKQGVLIPAENVDDLMLRDDVVEAVWKKKFHIYPVANVEEGVQILTGVRAGCRDGKGKFEENTLFAFVDERLRRMAQTLHEYE